MSSDANDGLSDALGDLANDGDDKIYAEPLDEEDSPSDSQMEGEEAKEDSKQDAFNLTDNIVADIDEEEIAEEEEEQGADEKAEPEPAVQARQPSSPKKPAARDRQSAAPAPAPRRRPPQRAVNTDLKAFMFPILGTLGMLLIAIGVMSIAGIGPGSNSGVPGGGETGGGSAAMMMAIASWVVAVLLIGVSITLGVQVFKERAIENAEKEARA